MEETGDVQTLPEIDLLTLKNGLVYQSSSSFKTCQSNSKVQRRDTLTNYKSGHLVLQGNDNKGGIWLGGLGFAQDIDNLKSLNIGAIVSMYQFSIPEDQRCNFFHFVSPLDDSQDQQITKPLKYSKHTNILVHCLWGVSRSAAIVVGYLMLSQQLSYQQSFNMMKSARECIDINPRFQKQLRKLSHSY